MRSFFSVHFVSTSWSYSSIIKYSGDGRFSLKIHSCFLPSGVTFSFFWKTQDQQTKFPPASGGQVISSGFKICSSEGEGSVEFYTRGNAMMKWKASFSPPGKFTFFFFMFYIILVERLGRCNGTSTSSGKCGHKNN